MKLHGQEIDRLHLERVSGDPGAAGGVREVVLDNGTERGNRVLEFRTGTGLQFEIMVDRAMDIGPAEHQGRSFGWRSPAGFRHPSLHENADERGFAWLRSMSGLLATGGLDHTLGAAEVDASNYNSQHRKTVQHPLHGRIAYTPARLQGYGELWRDNRCLLWAEGTVRQAEIFGEHMEMHRGIETELGSNEIRIHDVVTNRGFDRTTHMMLYHTNYGWPLVDEGSRVVAPIINTRWQTESIKTQGHKQDVLHAPGPGYFEQVYEHVLAAGSDGNTAVMLVNDRLQMAVEMVWAHAELPCFLQWNHLREGAYAVGLEPVTHHAEGHQAARDDGSMIWLNHGESRTYRMTIRVLNGEAEIAAAEKRIRSLIK